MGLREQLARSKGLGTAVAAGLLVIGVIAIGYQYASMKPSVPSPPQAYYTVDEGTTLFTDASDLLPPFDHGGKQAVRAYVYECSGKQFVGYLERYTPDAKRMVKELDDAVKHAKPGTPPPANLGQLTNARRFGREVKRPGDSKWTPIGSKEASVITVVKTPAGMAGEPELVQP